MPDLNSIGSHPAPAYGSWAQEVYFSSGVPTSGAFEGAYSINRITGDLYRYLSGAWVLQVSGQQVYKLAGSATPSATPTGGGIAYNENADVWVWSGAVWNKIVAGEPALDP